MPDPRRSVRSKQTAPLTSGISRQTSASSTSARPERNPRSVNRHESRNASATPGSSPSEGAPSEQDARRTRNSRREQAVQVPGDKLADDDIDVPEDGEEDENETTRCLCRQQDYPGPPIPLPSYNNRSRARRDAQQMAARFAQDGPSEDNGALFIQCEICHDWQHGGCVGIFDEAQTPEHYWCNVCKPEYHKLYTGQGGRKFSDYQPPAEAPSSARRKQPSQKELDAASPKNADANAVSSATKRRSTMNSRAAWEEEETLRRVMEESRGDGTTGRKAKRGRDESELSQQDVKRRKTDSDDEDVTAHGDESPAKEEDSDGQEGKSSRASANSKRTKANADLEPRDNESLDREREKERERAEAAGRRKGRAEKRNPDTSEPPEEPSRPPSAKQGARNSRNRSGTETGPDGTPVLAPAVLPKKPGRQPARRGKLGRNQYTRDREGGDKKDSDSRDSDNVSNGGIESHPLPSGTRGRGGRQVNPNRTSLNEMRKRATAMLDFVSRTQVEMATDKTRPSSQEAENPSTSTTSVSASASKKEGANGSKLSSQVSPVSKDNDEHHENGDDPDKDRDKDKDALKDGLENIDNLENAENAENVANGDTNATPTANVNAIENKLAVFANLGTLEMMDVLTRQIHVWQKDHGKQA